MVTESYYQQGINPDENILMFPHYRSDSKPQDLLIQVPDSFPHLWRSRKKNYNEQTKDCIALIYKLRTRVHLLKPEEEECFLQRAFEVKLFRTWEVKESKK